MTNSKKDSLQWPDGLAGFFAQGRETEHLISCPKMKLAARDSFIIERD